MARKVVLRSVNAPDGVHCVDILAFPDGRFGYVLCRRDPEDPHGWRVIDASQERGFNTQAAAEDAAVKNYAWL